jgi:hypothetical protein
MLILSEEEYLSINGASRQGIGDCALHKNIKENQKQELVERQAQKDRELLDRRETLRKEYQLKLEAGEVRPPTRTERLIMTANGHDDRGDVKAARRILEKQGIEWRNVKVI